MKAPQTRGTAMKVLTITNNKGGVGKTTSAVSIGAALKQLGYRVLLGDLDTQFNLTQNLCGRGVELESHVGDVLMGAALLADVIVETESGLDVLPASKDLISYEPLIAKQKDYQLRLQRALQTVKDQYDFVVLDCPPNLGTMTYMAFCAADAYVIPSEPEMFAYEGLQRVKEVGDLIEARLNPGLCFAGIFFTAYNPKIRNSARKAVVDIVGKDYGKEAILPNVREDSALHNAQIRAKTIYEFKPESNAAQDYLTLTQAILTKLN